MNATGQKLKYELNIEGSIYEWGEPTIRVPQIRELAHFDASQPLVEVDLKEPRIGIKSLFNGKDLDDNQAASFEVVLLDDKGKQALAKVKQEVEEVKKVVPAKPPVAHALTEGTPEDMHVYVRGNVKKEGEVAERHFLSVLAGDEPPRFTQGSGRLSSASRRNQRRSSRCVAAK